MIFLKRTIRTTSIPKIRKIHSGVWKLKAKNLQNCQFWPKNGLKWTKFRHIRIFQAYRVWFSERGPSEQLPYQKLGRFIVAFGSYRSKTLRTVNFGQKMAKFWPQIAKFWPSQNFPGIYTMIFSKKTTRVVSIPKIMKIYSGVWKI